MKPSLLVIELHHLGDGVMALPFLKAAQKAYTVTVLCTASVAEMLNTLAPSVETLVAADGWPARFQQVRRVWRSRNFAISVCAWSDTRCHLLARLTGAPRRIGFPTNQANYYATHLAWRQRRLKAGQLVEEIARRTGQPLLTTELNRVAPNKAHLENWRQLAGVLQLELALEIPWFPPPTAALPSEVEAFLRTQKAAGRSVGILHAGGRLPTKRWPGFQEVLDRYFKTNGIPVVIIQPPGETVPQPEGPWQVSYAPPSHAHLARIIAEGDFFLGNDSYAAHVAAALGKKTVTIFGSGNPDWFAPYGQETRVCSSSICPYHPCIDRCQMPDVICLADVPPDAVIAQLKHI